MAEIDLIIFDCDGVLIDSEVISARVLIKALATVGIKVDFPYVQKHFLGRSWTRVAAEIRRSYGFSPGADFETMYREELLTAFEDELRTTPGVEAAIDGVTCRKCVATSSSPKRVRRSLELSGLADRFGNDVFTASEVANGKPAPDLFFHAAARMGAVPARCLVIEDSMPGVLAARNAGMMIVRYTGGKHLAGLAATELSEGGVLRCFDNWADFREIMDDLEGTGGKGRIGA